MDLKCHLPISLAMGVHEKGDDSNNPSDKNTSGNQSNPSLIHPFSVTRRISQEGGG